ncbi:MAG: MarR family transcriptional regulator [Terriglobia bacterium]
MTIRLLTERYAEQIAGVVSCFDRIIVQGTLPIFCCADGMTRYLAARAIRIFDFTQFVKPLTEAIKANAERPAEENRLTVDCVRKKNFRQEDRIQEVLPGRGTHPGLVWIFSALEPCTTYQPWHNKKSGRTYLRPHDGKCLPYYFYFIDEELGLCYVRVPTWCPFRLQFYCNGHNRLAAPLDRHGISYTLLDNAFTAIGDFARAQQLADGWDARQLHRKLDGFARRYCPILEQIEETYPWSLGEAAYATDIVFHRQADLQAIYSRLIRTAVHTVKPDDMATFLGKKLDPRYAGEMGNRYNVRIEGTRVRHSMGMASIKMYDKLGHVLRLETTTKDLTFFKHYRGVEQRDGALIYKFARMKKSIYSLAPLAELLRAANRRYLEFLSALQDPSSGLRKLGKLSRTVHPEARSYRGFNFFDDRDQLLFETIVRGEFNISGFQNKSLRRRLSACSSGQISRLLKRLRTHGLIKKAGRCYKYHLTPLGKQVAVLGLKLKEMFLVPELALTSS